MAIITYPLNGIDYTADDAETYLCTRISGVYASDGHFDVSVTGDREVTIGTGLAWIRNTDHCGKSVYNDTPVAVTVPVADGALDRIDRIVLRFSKTENASEIAVKEGTPSSSPKAPEVTRTEVTYELGLYTVAVGASSVTVSAGDLTDTRMDEEVCGLMRDGVTGIPTAQLQEQAEALIEELKEEIEKVETGSDVMLKTVYDPAGGDRQVAFKDELVDTLYPVGSVYISVNSADPSTFFGGEWEQLEDTFLLAAGTEYAGGSTGGAATVALSSSEMPSHTHSLPSHTHSIPALSGTAASAGAHTHRSYCDMDIASGSAKYRYYPNGTTESTSAMTTSDGAHTHTVTTVASTTGSTSGTSESTGSGSAHNNMPPYLAVYMWKRVE